MIITAIILAAGKSTRFPGNKMLKEIELSGVKAPLVRHTVTKFIRSKMFDNVFVVLGHDKELVLNAANVKGVKYVISQNYEKGMSASVKAGAEAVMNFTDILAIHPGDVPFVFVETLKDLVRVAVQEYSFHKDFILIPKYRPLNKGGHPLIIGKKLIPFLLDISEETKGLKGFLRKFNGRIKYVLTEDLGVLADIDRPEDLVRDLELIKRESV